jgi:hypothetical protein
MGYLSCVYVFTLIVKSVVINHEVVDLSSIFGVNLVLVKFHIGIGTLCFGVFIPPTFLGFWMLLVAPFCKLRHAKKMIERKRKTGLIYTPNSHMY